MVERISFHQFTEAEGVDDWAAAADHATARFKTGSFSTGVGLITEIGQLADAMNHHPDVDLRYPHVTVSLTTHEVDGLSQRDVDLARQISDAAARRGIEAEPLD